LTFKEGKAVNVYSGGAAAAAAAAAHKRKMEEEEERLTSYTKDQLTEGWEFKIVRSVTAIRSERFSRLLAEEAQNGWELVEKFDHNRVRFKRPIANRANDQMASIDPYRTRLGLSEGAFVLVVLGAFIGLGLFLALLVKALS
jgi:DNA-binding transcriptional regulator YiaG